LEENKVFWYDLRQVWRILLFLTIMECRLEELSMFRLQIMHCGCLRTRDATINRPAVYGIFLILPINWYADYWAAQALPIHLPAEYYVFTDNSPINQHFCGLIGQSRRGLLSITKFVDY